MTSAQLLPILTKRCQEIIAKADAVHLKDVYVVFIYVEDDNTRMPELSLGWNTNATWIKCCPKPGQQPHGSSIAYSAGEAKWNFAFWEDDEGTALMAYHSEEEGEQLKREWMLANDFYVDRALRDSDFEEYLRRCSMLSDALWQLGADLALALRKEKFFTDVFGHQIPILVLECHMDDRMNKYIPITNPDGQAKDFDGWVAIDPYTGEICRN